MRQLTVPFTLGYFTAALPDKPLEEQVEWASERGFEALELAAWPVPARKDYRGGNLDVRGLSPERLDALRQLFEQRGLKISALGYYDNCLHPAPAERERILQHLEAVIQTAESLKVGLVGIFIGRFSNRSEEENLREVPRVFDSVVRFASDHGVRLMIENCPMVGWQQEGLAGNLGYRPGIWDPLFDRYEALGLNFDPSHLVWQGMDPFELFSKYADRIYHVHAKDVVIDRPRLGREGCLSRGWWHYRLPGFGVIDWTKFFLTLLKGGYAGTVSIEHEDPEWSGKEEKVLEGMDRACREMKEWRDAAGSEYVASRSE